MCARGEGQKERISSTCPPELAEPAVGLGLMTEAEIKSLTFNRLSQSGALSVLCVCVYVCF